MTAAIEVLRVTGTVLVQDGGRPGFSHLGVTPSGAADRGSRLAAVRLVGGGADDAVLEIEGAFSWRADADVVVSVAGAPGSVDLDGEPVASGEVFAVAAGRVVQVGAAQWGRRRYLAVRGGIDVPAVLGSRSTDVLSGLGPEPVRAGDRLPVGAAPAVVDALTGTAPPAGVGPLTMLDASPGPRADRVSDADALWARAWRVSHLGDRVGVRLEGEPLARARTDELPSEGVVTGSVQVPPNGQPVILGPDHPVTGGYPVVAVLTSRACDAAAQLRPGGTVRFRRA